MIVSIAYKNDDYCIMIEKEGQQPIYHTGKVYDSVSDNRYNRSLFLLKKAFLFIRNEVTPEDDLITVEGSNSHVLSWFQKGEGIAEHRDEFTEVYNLMCSIPCKIGFVYKKRPKAKNHLDEAVESDIVTSDAILDM